MKMLLLLTMAGVLSVVSIYGVSEPIESTSVERSTPTVLVELARQISQIKLAPQERNQRLRYERAKYYYQSAQHNLAADWQKRAIEDAKRGLRLLAMNSGSV